MKKASISQTKNNLSAYLDLVRHGETILITDRNKPVARLEPIVNNRQDDSEGRLARLERAGIVRRSAKRGVAKSIVNTLPPSAEPRVSVLKALLEERSGGR
jgi:prevent-host-death family protein